MMSMATTHRRVDLFRLVYRHGVECSSVASSSGQSAGRVGWGMGVYAGGGEGVGGGGERLQTTNNPVVSSPRVKRCLADNFT